MREAHGYENDMVIGFQYEDDTYYFEKNAQGDVLSIYDEAGTVVSEYIYDAWGNVVDIVGDEELAKINPFRYRGYYQDNETGFYYLQSRYYDGVTGRFLNADEITYITLSENFNEYNMFSYCNNNPVKAVDYNGHAAANIVGGIIGGIVGALLGYIIADALGLEGWKRWLFIGAVTVAGIVVGAVIGPYIARASKQIINVINSGIRKASGAALKASSKAKNFTVSAKHLSNAGGRYAKFATTEQSQVRAWIAQALKSSNATFYPNGSNSYYIITNMGKVIGTKGERFIKVVFDAYGNIWTAFPKK